MIHCLMQEDIIIDLGVTQAVFMISQRCNLVFCKFNIFELRILMAEFE